jgi:hypothetical protein
MTISEPEQVAAIQDVLQKHLKLRIASVLRKTQENRTDPFAFGELVRAKFPAVWAQKGEERWAATWSEAAVNVEANLNVVHVNMTTEPPNLIRSPSGTPGKEPPE